MHENHQKRRGASAFRRDADFRKDGTLSIWTVGGRKHLTYTVPDDFKATFEHAKEIDSLMVLKRDGKLIGCVTLTLEVASPQGILPIGIDLNETNALVAVDPDGRELFISGKAVKVQNRRTAKTRARLQSKHARTLQAQIARQGTQTAHEPLAAWAYSSVRDQ